MNSAKVFAIVLGLVLALVLALFGSVQAQDAFVGSWVLDPASSKAAARHGADGRHVWTVTAAGGGKYTIRQ